MSNIKGKVNEYWEAEISVEFVTFQKQINFIVDTGFDGDLVLPFSIVSELELPFLFRTDVELVGKTNKQVNFFRGQIKWLNDEIITVDVIADESFLIGTNLLRHGKLWIDYQSNEVLITK